MTTDEADPDQGKRVEDACVPLEPPPDFNCKTVLCEKYNVETLSKRVANDQKFAEAFAAKVKEANLGDQDAIACIEAWYEPSSEDLRRFGIHPSRWGSMRKCTDASLLFLSHLKAVSPNTFV